MGEGRESLKEVGEDGQVIHSNSNGTWRITHNMMDKLSTAREMGAPAREILLRLEMQSVS